jgi:hypothetical protein
VAAFVADADAAGLREHCANLLRLAWFNRDHSAHRDPLRFTHAALQRRWGTAALLRHGVTHEYVVAAMYEVLPLKQPQTEQQTPEQTAVATAGGSSRDH